MRSVGGYASPSAGEGVVALHPSRGVQLSLSLSLSLVQGEGGTSWGRCPVVVARKGSVGCMSAPLTASWECTCGGAQCSAMHAPVESAYATTAPSVVPLTRHSPSSLLL